MCPDLVSLTDLLPTLLTELGLPYPGSRELEGVSLLGCPGGGLGSPRDAVFVEFGHRPAALGQPAHPPLRVRAPCGGVARGAVRPAGSIRWASADCSAAEPQVTAELRAPRSSRGNGSNGLPETFTGPWSDPRAAPE